MGKLKGGLAAYLAKKKQASTPLVPFGGQVNTPTQSVHPMVPMSPAMVSSIKKSPKGVLPPGLAKWLATHKKGAKGVKKGK